MKFAKYGVKVYAAIAEITDESSDMTVLTNPPLCTNSNANNTHNYKYRVKNKAHMTLRGILLFPPKNGTAFGLRTKQSEISHFVYES